jgi:hypothetical protein
MGIALLAPESIEWFIEYQVFSPSHDLAPSTPPNLSPKRMLLLFLSLPVCFSVWLTDGRGVRGVGKEPTHPTARKPYPL